MKKILFSLIFIFCSWTILMGKEPGTIGLKLGMVGNYVQHSGNYPKYMNVLPGISSHISIFKTFSFTPRMSLQTSLEWLQQSTMAEIVERRVGADVVDPQYRRTKTTFISLPLLYRYRIESFFITVGPAIAFLIKSQYEHFQKAEEGPPASPKRWRGYDITDEQKPLHFSLRAGIGKVFTFSRFPFTVEIYYWNDFTDFSYREDKWTEQGIMFSLGLFLN